jgi:hypothetical protein
MRALRGVYGRRKPSISARAQLLAVLVLITQASDQSPPVVPYPRAYKNRLVRYAEVDRLDGMSRDLCASRDAIEAPKRDPRLREFPAGVLFVLDVYSGRLVSRDLKTSAPRFETTAQGHPVRSKDERTLHLILKIHPGRSSSCRATANSMLGAPGHHDGFGAARGAGFPGLTFPPTRNALAATSASATTTVSA